MTEREQFEAWAEKSKVFPSKYLASKHDSGEYFFHEAHTHWEAWQAARAASPKVPQGVEEAYQALQNELIQIQATIESFATPAAALSALIDWHVAVATDPRVNGGMALVPVGIAKFLEDREAIEGVLEWARNEEQTVNIGWVQSDQDEHLESSAGWVTRLLKVMLAATKEKGE